MTDHSTRYRVVLADDHPLLRESIATFIEDHAADRLQVVAQAADGLGALEAVQKHEPHLVLLDLSMPRLGGLEAIGRLRALGKPLLILVLSSYDDQAHILDAIRAGADDYLFKKYATAEVVVGNILRALGERPLSRVGTFQKLIQSVRDAGLTVVEGAEGVLTGLDLEILKKVAFDGASNAEIVAELARNGAPLSEEAVAKKLAQVIEKLGARTAAHAVCLAIKNNQLSADDSRRAG